MWNWSDTNEMHLEAARGWLELGDHQSALQELEDLTGLRRAQPDVLKLRLQIYVLARKWRNAYAIAEGLARVLPNDPEVFVWRAQAARWMPGGGLSHAMTLLLEVANDFPDDPSIPFRLACYNCQMGNHATAGSWLQIAFDAARRAKSEMQWLAAAQEEPDLKPLHKILAPASRRPA